MNHTDDADSKAITEADEDRAQDWLIRWMSGHSCPGTEPAAFEREYEALARLITEVRLETIEACAKVCDDEARYWNDRAHEGQCAAENCSHNIRKSVGSE